jgi:hypothetical protein
MPLSPEKITPAAQRHILAERERIIDTMQRQYPGMRLREINEIAYRKDRLSPEEIVRQGGFIPRDKDIRLATAFDSPNNSGLSDFTLVPEVATIFSMYKTPAERYVYAAPLDKGYLMPGQWRQVAMPALPVKEFLVGRKILANDGRTATLGEPVVIGTIPEKYATDEAFQRFLHAPALEVPQDIGLGDENYPPHYTIRDTPASKQLFPQR